MMSQPACGLPRCLNISVRPQTQLGLRDSRARSRRAVLTLSLGTHTIRTCAGRGRQTTRAPVTTSSSVQQTPSDSHRLSTRTMLKQAYTAHDSLQYGIGSYVIPEDDKEQMLVSRTVFRGPSPSGIGPLYYMVISPFELDVIANDFTTGAALCVHPLLALIPDHVGVADQERGPRT
eukprot:498026-Prorocentrum_minimum.AAC.1